MKEVDNTKGMGQPRFSEGVAGVEAATVLGSSGSAAAESHFRTVEVTPADRRYPDLVRGLNQRWVGNPEAVYLVSTTPQVVDVVQRAVRMGERISVHSGGHCFEDFVFNPSVQVVVDMSEFNEVYFDRARNAFAVEAGARLLDVYEKLYRLWGITLPAGVCTPSALAATSAAADSDFCPAGTA